MQHWTWVMGRAQQMMMEHLAEQMGEAARRRPTRRSSRRPGLAGRWSWFGDPAKITQAQVDLWTEGLSIWQRALGGPRRAGPTLEEKADKDRRFAAPEWRDNPLFDTIRQTYLLISDRLLGSVDAIEGVDAETREKMRFIDPRLRRRDEPVQLRADQPAGDRAGDRDQGREPAQGPRAYAARPRQGPAQPYRRRARSRSAATSRRRRARSSSRRALYQLIQYTPDDRQGARDAADHLPALDQPLLHPRPQPEEELHPLGGRAGADRVRRLVEIGRREPRRRHARRLCARRRSRRSTRCARRSASRACTRSAIASPAPTLAATLALLAARGEADKVASGDLLHRPGRFLARPATSSCSSATSRWS